MLALLGALMASCSPEKMEEVPPAGMRLISAHGVSLHYPEALRLKPEVDEAGVKLYFRKEGGLPLLLVQVYKVDFPPAKALEINLREHRELYARKDWKFTETASSELIAGRQVDGTETVYTVNGVELRQRFFTFKAGRRTVFVMTMCKGSDDGLTRELLGPICASIH